MTDLKRFVCFTAALSLCMFLMLPSTASANLLTNPGFEVAAGGPGTTPDDWVGFVFTTSSTQDLSMPHSGSAALVEGGGGTSTGGSTGVFQEVFQVNPGTEFTLSVWAKAGALPISSDDTYGGAVARIQFELAGGADLTKAEVALGPLGTPGVVRTGNGLLTTQYQQFTVSGIAPPTAQQLKVQLYSRHSDQLIYFDDVMLTKVPEPASIGLALFGGLGAFGMRRRARR